VDVDSYVVGAEAFLGFGEASAHALVQLTDPDGDTRKERKLIRRVVVTPIGYSKKQGSGEFLVTKTFQIERTPSAGAEFLVQAGVESSSGAAAACSAGARVGGKVSQIVIEPLA
jgi:hypothetical protein